MRHQVVTEPVVVLRLRERSSARYRYRTHHLEARGIPHKRDYRPSMAAIAACSACLPEVPVFPRCGDSLTNRRPDSPLENRGTGFPFSRTTGAWRQCLGRLRPVYESPDQFKCAQRIHLRGALRRHYGTANQRATFRGCRGRTRTRLDHAWPSKPFCRSPLQTAHALGNECDRSTRPARFVITDSHGRAVTPAPGSHSNRSIPWSLRPRRSQRS